MLEFVAGAFDRRFDGVGEERASFGVIQVHISVGVGGEKLASERPQRGDVGQHLEVVDLPAAQLRVLENRRVEGNHILRRGG